MSSEEKGSQKKEIPSNVAVHPLVLLSIVDHFNRVCQKNRRRRVVGVLLGEYNKGQLDVTNCYALPFEEDPRESNIWFVDHLFHETMYAMFKKINAKEVVVGWYTTGQMPKAHDLQINHLFSRYLQEKKEGVLVIIDPEHTDALALPTQAFVEQQHVDTQGHLVRQFLHVDSSIEAFEAEEVGVEHLLREIKDMKLNSLGNNLQDRLLALQGMASKVKVIKEYLDRVSSGQKASPEILNNLQDIFNLLPTLDNQLHQSFITKNNDNMFAIYQASLVKSVFALHELLDNKLDIKEKEKELKNSEKEKGKKEEKKEEKK